MDLELKVYAFNDKCPKCNEDWDASNEQDVSLPDSVELLFECSKCGHERVVLVQVYALNPTIEVDLCREHRHLSAAVVRIIQARYPHAEVGTKVSDQQHTTTFVPATYSREEREEIIMLVNKLLTGG